MQNFLLGSGIVGRLTAIGLPKYLSLQLSQEVNKYVQNCGPAWTVSRLKSLKLDFIRERAGLPVLSWVRKNRKGSWYGIWGALRSYAKKSDRCFNRVINSLMLYSGFIPSKPTPEHIKKFRSSVGAPGVFIPPDVLRSIGQHTSSAGLHVSSPKQQDFLPLIQFQGASSVKSPIVNGRSVKQSDSLEKELDFLTVENNAQFIRSFWDIYREVFRGIKRKEVLPGPPAWEVHGESRTPVGGHIVPLTKDGGWKVRWIASPYRIHQLALKPLGDKLYSLLRQLSWDCTFDQSKAIPPIQKHLSEGKFAFAVDLSSATDYFPLSLQKTVLMSLNMSSAWEQQVHLFSCLARAEWISPYGRFQWSKGQPMGLYPSFASFALSHGVLLDYLRTSPGQLFFILGDDVVILDEKLYEKYITALELLECPHEPNKTITSNRLTEFAGKIITDTSVFPQFKWKRVSDDNFLDLMRNFGQQFSTQLSRRERAVYDQVAELLPPYGCGHSRGPALGMAKAVEKTDEFEMSLNEKKRRKFYMSFLGFLVERLKPYNPASLWNSLRTEEVLRQQTAFDEKADAASYGTVFQHFQGDKTPLSDVLGVSGFPDLPATVPLKETSRESTLDFYERALGLR